MSFREWLYDTLISLEVITEDDFSSCEEMTEELLLNTTEVESWDLDEYKNQFELHCNKQGITPDFDLE